MKKRRRYLSVIVAPHHKGVQRSYHVSYAALGWLAAAGALLLLLLCALLVSYGKIYWRAGQYELMRRRQAEMESEFGKLQQIKAELARLRSEETKVRQMLGVPRQPDTLSTAEVAQSSALSSAPAPASAATAPVPDRLMPTLVPTRGWISSGFTPQHRGVDVAARQGQPVLAAADGLVKFAGWDSYFGNKVVVGHGDKFTTMYGHCEKFLVQAGQPVRQGQVIAMVGSSGESTGPHLHYEVFQRGTAVDPSNYWVNR